MFTRKTYLALAALALTAGIATAAETHYPALIPVGTSVPAACTTNYGAGTDANGRSTSMVSLTCSRPVQRRSNGAAL